VGVSFNKVYAKLASDLKKPDAVTVISRENYRDVVYPLPVTDLLLVGKSTSETLAKFGVYTIGDLAACDEAFLMQKMGKRGRQIRVYARGEDEEPVKAQSEKEDIKSIGNSATLPYDVRDRDEIKRWFYVLSESVTARLRDADVGKADTVHIVVRNENFEDSTWQTKVPPTALCSDVAQAAYKLFCEKWKLGAPVHMLGVTVSGFDHHVSQMTFDQLLGGDQNYDKKERAENAVAKIREKYGYATLQRGVVMQDEKLYGLDIRKGTQKPKNSKNDKDKKDEI
jgi:DNA polymerase-4